MDDILKYDSDFSENKFKSFVDNVFIQIHLAIMTKELEKVKHFMNETVYEQMLEKINTLENKIQMYDEINVKQTSILNYSVLENQMRIEVNITSRYMDYIMDEDGNVISGVNTHRIEKENYLIFEKKINFESSNKVRKCPGCQASIDINANGLCAYCGTTYNLEEKDWILTSLKIC